MSQQRRDPTPEEIAAACAEIQSTWSPNERLRRLRSDWQPVVGTADGRTLPVDAADYAVSTVRPVAPLGDEPAQCVATEVRTRHGRSQATTGGL